MGTVGCPSGQREQTVNLPAHAYEGSNPSPTTGCWQDGTAGSTRGCSSVGRASAFQAEGRGFESRRPLYCSRSSVVERVLGKDEAMGSIPIASLVQAARRQVR